jgi:DNA-directed RNA polymerase subunit A'
MIIFIIIKMDKALTNPIRYLFRLVGEEGESEAVTIINPLSSAKTTENDPALGPQAIGTRCATCTQDIYHCPGHIGAIKVYPVPVPLAEKNLTLWLSSVCHICGRIGISNDERRSILQRKGSIEFKDIQAALQAKSRDYLCPFCMAPFQVFRPVGFFNDPGYDFSRPALYYVDFPGKKSEGMLGKAGYHELPIADNYYTWSVLKNATEEDCALFGWNTVLYHPRGFMWDHIPIAPPAARPRPSSTSHYVVGKTHKLHNLIAEYQVNVGAALGGRFLPQVQEELKSDPLKFKDLVMNIFYLYYAVIALQTRLTEGLQTTITRVFKLGAQKGGASYVDMLRQKGGVLRKQMAGSRHNVCARTPLTAFTYGAIGTATCPLEFAMKICVDRTVTPENIELMRALVRNGPDVYPGANAYKKGGKGQINFSKKESEVIAASLVPGDVVMRHVMTGDVALHQRYPSVREESINAVMLVVDPGKLIRIPLAVCAMMMADFDGDDTELFFVSSYGVAAEALYLTSVLHKFIAPYDGKPCIGIGGDAGVDPVAGINLLRKRQNFTQQEINALFTEAFTAVSPPSGKSVYSFLDIVSALLPKEFYYDAKANGDMPGGDLRIEAGVVTRGEVTSKAFEVLGSNNAHLTKALAVTLDPYTAIKVLEDITRIAYRANTMYGWSISDDLRILEPYKSRIEALVDERIKKIDICCNQFHMGELAIPIGQDPLDFFERVVAFSIASKNSNEAFEEVQKMLKGSQFDYYGYTQTFRARLIPALISRGQVLPEEHRLRPKLSHNTRHNVWYPKSYDGADAGGYIRSSYIQKLTPREFFCESIPARGEVFTKGFGLQEQGYYNRKVGTSLGPVHIGYLGEVRGHNDMILDFYYGHTGADSHCCVNVYIDDHLISEKEFVARHGSIPDELATLRTVRDEWRAAIADYAKITSNEQFTPETKTFESPFDIGAIIMSHVPLVGTVWKSIREAASALTATHALTATNTSSEASSSEASSSEADASSSDASKGTKGTKEPKGSKEPKEPTKGTKEPFLSRQEIWDILKTMPDMFVLAHVGKRAGEFIRTIAQNRVNAFMRLFRFTCTSGRLFSLGKWTEKDVREMLAAMLCKYAVCLVPAGDMVGLKAALDIIAPQTQAQLHAIRGGTEIKGTASTLGRTHGTQLFREKTEGLTPQNPLSSFMLRGPLRSNLQECLDYVKRISSVRLMDVLYKAWLVSVSPEELEKTEECGFAKLRRYIASLPPTVRKILDQTRRSWFYAVLHIDSFRLLTNHVEISTVGKRLQSQFPDAIELAMSVYENQEGLYVFLSLKADSIDLMRSFFDAILERGVVHGHPAFSNGTIIKYNGFPNIGEDGTMTGKAAYRIMLNGCDLAFLFAQREIDKSTITTSNIIDSSIYFGIEEARFRAFEEMVFETHQMEELKGILKRHIKVFVDYLAYRGTLTFVPRFAVGSNPDVDDLDKMTFETADSFLMKALEDTRWRHIRGIMPCNLFGTPPPFGSTMSSVRVRTKDMDPKIEPDVMEGLKAKRVKQKESSSSSTSHRVVAVPLDRAVSETVFDDPARGLFE